MRSKRILHTMIVGLVAATSLAATASAHNTVYSPDGKLRFVYGHIGEPIFTHQKTGLDLGVYDNATRAPITGLAYSSQKQENLKVEYRYGGEGGQRLDISNGFVAQHGQEGRYTYPIMFTRPGFYSLVITGNINGTQLTGFVIPPAHELKEIDTIMWPDGSSGSDDTRIAELEDEVSQLRSEVRQMRSNNGGAASPGIEAAVLVTFIAVAALWLPRRQ